MEINGRVNNLQTNRRCLTPTCPTESRPTLLSLLQKAIESQTEIPSRSGISFILSLFQLARAVFLFFSLLHIQSLCFIHSKPHLHAVICWGKLAHSPPRDVPTKPKHPNTGRGQHLRRHSRYSTSLC